MADNAFLAVYEALDDDVRVNGVLQRLDMDPATQALLSLSMVAAKLQVEMVPAHVRQCVEAGLGRTEVAEVLMQVYCYAGVYPSIAAFRASARAFDELEAQGRLTPGQSAVDNRPPPSRTCAQRIEHGLEIRRSLFGAEEIDATLSQASSFDKLFDDLTHDFCFGNIWARPTFDRAMRSQLCLAIASATGQHGAVARHTQSAVLGGVPWRRIAEIFQLAYVYGGAYNARASFEAAKPVLEKFGVALQAP